MTLEIVYPPRKTHSQQEWLVEGLQLVARLVTNLEPSLNQEDLSTHLKLDSTQDDGIIL